MALKKNASTAKLGMNTDKAVWDLGPQEYSFALNVNFDSEHGTGKVNLQNEPSNLLCTGFTDRYRVIGHKYDVNSDRTYFFLTNPLTGCSEIGYIDTLQNFQDSGFPTTSCDGCNGIEVTLETPLEDQTQTAICNYTVLLTDECVAGDCSNSCLNFDVDYPIHESNVEIKTEKTGVNMYFNDGLNPRRYLQLDNLSIYTEDVDPCTGLTTATCLQCNELRVDKLFSKPCLTVRNIANGGSLRAGTYEITVAYSTSTGDEISNYYAKTSPVTIYDTNNNILDQTNLDYLTNQAISVSVADLDNSYDFFKVAVIYRSGLDAASRVLDFGVYPVDTEGFTISSIANKETLRLSDIFSRKPFYTTAKGLATGNGFLFHYGMEAQREVNLQPVVNLMGMFVKWMTVAANENIYEDGANVANFRAYMRDEVVPLSIQFFGEGGYETSLFNFIPRPAKASEIEVLGAGFTSTSSTRSILAHTTSCDGNNRDKRWQFENTATIDGICAEFTASGGSTVITTEELSCFADDGGGNLTVIDTIAAGSLEVDLGGVDLATYINQNSASIIAGGDPQWAAVVAIIGNPAAYPESCTPTFPANCGALTLVSEEALAISTTTEDITQVPGNIDSEDRTAPVDTGVCFGVSNPLSEDTTFRDTYLAATDTVYQRSSNTNTSCAAAQASTLFTVPPAIQINNSFTLDYVGALGSNATLLSGVTSSAAGAGFNTQVHSNAVWYKVDLTGLSYVAIELSTATIQQADSVHSNQLRYTVVDNCASTTDLAAYSNIITDIALSNDTNKYVILDASDFTGNSAFIAIDSTMEEEVEFEIEISDPIITLTLTGTSGSADISVNGTAYTAIFNTDLNTTGSDFEAAEAANILGAEGVTVTDLGGGVIEFTGATLSTIAITGVLGDLSGSATTPAVDITLDGNLYSENYDTDLATTATNFITNHAANLLATSNIIATNTGSILEFRSTQAIYLGLITGGDLTSTVTFIESYHVLHSPGGCTNFHHRAVTLLDGVDFTDLTFGKSQTYSSDCTTDTPGGLDCDPIPHRYGDFSYWESTLNYPCNDELYDSSTLVIQQSDLPAAMQPDFETYYVDAVTAGTYTLSANTDFRDTPIRHYKFPCSGTVPFMSEDTPGSFNKSLVFPIGFSIDAEVIRTFLDVAANNGLISIEERALITRYEIFRGDRTTDKSVVAKGLLFDVYGYTEETGTQAYYPNYPLNTLGTDTLNGNVLHPQNGLGNRQFTFHSPDTHFNKPTLPGEMKIEGYLMGKSASYFDAVKDHPTYTILGQRAISLATTLSILETSLEIAVQIADWSVLGATGAALTTVVAIGIAVVAGIAFAASALINTGRRRYEWLETIRNLGHPKNFAYYSATVGHYNFMIPNTDNENSLRALPTTQYIGDGRWNAPDETNGTSFDINNVDREESVFLSLGQDTDFTFIYDNAYTGYDTAGTPLASRRVYNGVGRSGRLVGNAASPYVALKQYLPEQYGSIYSVDWISTGYCGDIDAISGCDPIFGGDTFISRFSVKRKFPFFTETSHGLAPLTPFKYSDYFNVNPNVTSNRTFVDYRINDDADNVTFGGLIFPSDLSNYSLNPAADASGFYIEPPSKFYLYSYGFPHFLVESPINCNYRYAKRELHENFYPNFGDVIKNTQESNISIREPNTFFYNDVYSLTPTRVPTRTLPVDYNRVLFDKLNTLTNTTVYSLQDNSEQDLTDPWLVYRPLDAYQFPTSYGDLVDMDGIESEQILGRFENGLTIFGAIDQVGDRFASDTGNLGTGGIFSGRNVNFNKTDQGYGGTQHIAKVSNEFGHFWPDVKRGEVFQLEPNGKNLQKITEGKEKWFKEHLPFKILKEVSGLDERDIDNSYKGLGIAMGWDARSKRIFLTKLDYKPIVTGVTYVNREFLHNGVAVSLTDTTVFKNCSFTVAYSPLTKTWISYYSFLPQYYVGYVDYFQTGINDSADATEVGLWSHIPFLGSYQVFYGKLYPFTIEMPIPAEGTNSTLNSLEYWMDVRKYYDKYDFSDIVGSGFDTAVVFNNYQNTGTLNLVTKNNDDMSQDLDYPKHNATSVDILQSEIAGKYSFNYIYNAVRNERSRVPLWSSNPSGVDKNLVTNQFDHRNMFKDRMRGDYFMLRLANNSESRYKMIFRSAINTRNFTQD